MTRNFSRRALSGALLITASTLAMITPAIAHQALFSSDPELGRAAAAGERVTQQSGVTQLRLDNGGTASFVEGASFQLRSDGSIDLFSGSVTVASGEGSPVVVHLADKGKGTVEGRGSAASFSVDENGEANGHVLTGQAAITIGTGTPRQFSAGQMWRGGGDHPVLAVANGEAAVPDANSAPQIADMADGGPLAAAENGVPVVLGDALAAAGASGDIIAAARRVQAAAAAPHLETFPSGDLALLITYAGRLQGAYGGQPFGGAQADIIRTYITFLSNGGSGAQFLTTYAGLMGQYLDLMRSGALPSSFSGASLAQINSFISFRGRTSGFAGLTAQNRVLIDAYLAFILGGGNADQFTARYTSLTDAYFLFLRGGGDPLAFAGASQQTINLYLTFLRDSGLSGQLSSANQALLSAYLQSLSSGGNGLAFADQYRSVLSAYFTFLQAGNLPSSYTAVDAATLRSYLETLQATGLFERVLGTQAAFYGDYLVYLRSGGSVDGWSGLNANIFGAYSAQLTAYYEFLKNGGVPSSYTVLTQEQIRIYLAALQGAGISDRFLGDLSGFYTAFFAYLDAGSNPDLYANLPVPPDFPAFASALNAYAVYLNGGGLPGSYSGLTLAQLQAYLQAIISAGRLNELLGSNSALLSGYFAYLGGGGAADGYSGLPIYTDYAAALQAYYTFLQGGGLPSGYTLLTPAQLQAYLQALIDSGVFAAWFTGDSAAFLASYYSYVSGGGVPNQFAQLPVNTGGGSGTGGGGVSPPLLSYTGGFTHSLPKLNMLLGTDAVVVLDSVYSAQNYTLNSSGGLISMAREGAVSRAIGTASVTDIYGNSQALIGRWTNGTTTGNDAYTLSANQGFHYVLAKPFAVNFTLPTSGTINYNLLAATKPTIQDGSLEPGTFTGRMAVSFGAQIKAGMEATLSMPNSSGNTVYSYTTTGGVAAPSMTLILASSDLPHQNFLFTMNGTSSSGDCTLACRMSVYGMFAGDQNTIGLNYYASNRIAGKAIVGAAIFGAEGSSGSSTGGSGATTTQTGQMLRSVTYTTQIGSTARSSEGTFSSNNAEVSGKADGSISALLTSQSISIDTATNVDFGAADGVISWTRWTGGTISNVGSFGSYAESIPVNGGYAIVRGTPATNIPTTGTVNYTRIGNTAPVKIDGSVAPGTLVDANLSVGFATRKVGFSGHVSIGGQTLDISSPGGTTTPSMGLANDGTFSSFTNPAHLSGFLAGPGASHAGLSYYVIGGGALGTIAFAKAVP